MPRSYYGSVTVTQLWIDACRALANGMAADTAANGMVKAAAAEPPPKMYCSYDSIHVAIASSLTTLQQAGWAEPDCLLAISGGGLIPARILRSVLRRGSGNGGCAAIRVSCRLH
jgi:hypothetical protein